MTTNIESALADMLEGLSVSDGYYQLSIGRVGAVKLAERIVKNEPDLKAALGIDELGCGCDEADDNLKAAIKRAEDAEAERDRADNLAGDLSEELRGLLTRAEAAEAAVAELGAKLEKVTGSADAWWGEYDAELKAHAETKARAERAEAALAACTERCNEHVQDASERAEVAQAKAVALAAERDRLLATIERIDAVRRDFYEVRGDWADPEGAAALKAQMERAILGDPPFTLPTEAGVRFEARYGGAWEAYTTYSDGNGNAIYRGECGFNDADQIMTIYTDHRLLGADQ